MGLDINIGVNNDEIVFSDEYHDEENGYSLSREFCNFMNRKHVLEHEPELDQIGKITNIDISFLYEMENYPDENEQEFFLEMAESDEEKQKILDESEAQKAKLEGNLDNVLLTIKSLINKLEKIENLNEKLIKTDFDSLNSEYYFSDFNIDKGEGYIRNNFGQDLRNFKRFLEFAKEKGTETVWFNYW